MNLKPYGAKILVEVVEAAEVTSGGIILPDIGKEEKSEGVVISKGTNDICVEVGEKVVFGKYAGDHLSLENKNYRILRENEILAVYK